MVSFPWRWLSAVNRTLIELFRSSITAPPQGRVPRQAWCLRLHLRYTHAQNKQTKKKNRHNYTTGKLSDWSVKSLNSCRREKKNQGTSRRRWRVVLNKSHCIQYCLKSWSSHLPSAVRRIPLGALLIPRMTMRSIQAAVVYWVFGVSRLQKREKKHEWNLATLDLHCGSSTTELRGTLIGLNDNPSTYCYEF